MACFAMSYRPLLVPLGHTGVYLHTKTSGKLVELILKRSGFSDVICCWCLNPIVLLAVYESCPELLKNVSALSLRVGFAEWISTPCSNLKQPQKTSCMAGSFCLFRICSFSAVARTSEDTGWEIDVLSNCRLLGGGFTVVPQLDFAGWWLFLSQIVSSTSLFGEHFEVPS